MLLHRLGPEIEAVKDPSAVRWLDRMDLEKARAQHGALADVYRRHGIKVYYVEETRLDRPNALYVRDLVAMTPEGAIVARPALAARRGEERYVAQALAQLGVPIIKTIHGTGTFEGADLMWIDRKSVFLGIGNRTNPEGARQVEEELRRMGVENVIYVQVPYGQAHLDGIFNIASEDVAVVFPWQTPFVVAEALRDRGYRIIEVESVEEAKLGFATNFVALEPGRVVMPAGNPETAEKLRAAGVEIIELEIDELKKGWGGIHCMTAFLKRDSV